MNELQTKDEKRNWMLERCYDCLCENGLEATNVKMLGKACGMSSGNLFNYFDGKEQIVIESTAYCMAKIDDDFLACAPTRVEGIESYCREMPYRFAKQHGPKYRFMYQVYASPHYLHYGREFVKDMVIRYRSHAEKLSKIYGVPAEAIEPLIFTFGRICVHYAMFENEDYLKPQLDYMLLMIQYLKEKYLPSPEGE
ncbi:MAG: TetR/AcrR family transcriptional regulator [Oscillospiraceae bacterium]|nr:TetR/AcrR family transcriptional regulator [Oscillospiraceae bacterium]